MSVPVIIDCDPGHDDAVAILLAAHSLDLRGITTVHGNVGLPSTTANACKLVELAGLAHIPIAAGMERALVRENSYATGVHGPTGLDGAELPTPRVAPIDEHAVDFIYRIATEVNGLTLVPTGPLTNIATALMRYPELSPRIAQISLMGGSLTYGNATAAAEFNVWADPEAAHVVFSSGIPIKMVGLNVTREVSATRTHRERMRALGSRTATVIADLFDFYSEQLRERYGLPGGSMHDPLAVAALVDPRVLHFAPMHVAVELRGEHTYGMTICDHRHLDPVDPSATPRTAVVGQPANAEVAVAVHPDRFWTLLMAALRTYR